MVEALLIRLKRRMRPFGIKATKNPIELLLSDGFYAVFHRRWQEYFGEEQLKVIDGSRYRKKKNFRNFETKNLIKNRNL